MSTPQGETSPPNPGLPSTGAVAIPTAPDDSKLSLVRQFLAPIGLAGLAPSFVAVGYDNALVLANLDTDDLDQLKISTPGHRKSILLHSKRYFDQKLFSADPTPEASNKVPILSRAANRKLDGLNYWSRAKFRTTPFDNHLPVINSSNQPKLRIFLVRHGMSQANEDISLYTTVADHAVPLCSKGEKQAIQAGEAIGKYFSKFYKADKPDNGFQCRLWTSPYLRTRQTSELLQKHSSGWITDIQENMLLVEQQFGLFEGVDWYNGDLDGSYPNELEHYRKAAAFGGRFWAQVPLGESRFQVCQRVYLSFGTLHRDAVRHGINNIVIVSHGVTIRAFLAMWLHLTPEWFEEEPNPPNCAVRVIDDCVDLGYVWPEAPGNPAQAATSETTRADLLLTKSGTIV